MLLKIFKNRTVSSSGTWGTKNENNYEILNFEFPEELEEYNKRIVYYLGNQKVWDAIIDNKAILTNAITTKGSVKAYIWCTKSDEAFETDVDFRTQIFVMNFFENENADGIVPTPEQVDGFNTMLTAMNEKIEEIDELETTIENAETQRQENEETRQENESTRQDNEQTRQEQEADRERRTNEAISSIQDKTAEYNANAEAKTTAFNNNATQKTNDFNNNYTQKVNDFNTNASSKELAFNSNAESKTSTFNTNATNKTNDFNSNATEKTTAFNNNATSKTTDFNTNAENKTTAFNSNATDKTTNFDNNASEKTDEFNTNAQEKIDEYDEHIVEYQAQIDELQEEVEELSENMPWDTTEQATEISVDDAAKYSRNKLELFGNTSQDSTSGSQAIDYSEVINREVNFNDVTLLISTTNFNIKADTTYYIRWIFTDNTYVDASSTLDNIRLYNGTSIQKQFGGTNMVFTSQELDGITSVQVRATSTFASTYAGKTIKALVFSSDSNKITPDTYEPYTGGQPSPNPDYPQDIHVVTGNNSIGVQGKNLFDKNKVTIYSGYFSAAGVINGKGTNNSQDKWFYIPCKPNTTYKIIKPVTPVVSNNRFRIGTTASIPNNNSTLDNFWMVPDGNTVTQHVITTSNNAKYLCIYYGCNPNAWNDKILEVLNGLMISYFSSYPINLGSIELCKIRDYQDYIYKENGNWYKKNILNKYIFSGNENISKATNVFYTNDIANNILTSGIICLCNRMKAATNTAIGSSVPVNCCCFRPGDYSRFYFNLSSITTDINEIKQYLSNNNTFVIYPLATATSTQITDETLIAQLDAIYEHLQLVKGTNNITVTAEDIAPYMKLTYMQDLKSKLDNLDSRLALLE